VKEGGVRHRLRGGAANVGDAGPTGGVGKGEGNEDWLVGPAGFK
jgi:hypothetical protein